MFVWWQVQDSKLYIHMAHLWCDLQGKHSEVKHVTFSQISIDWSPHLGDEHFPENTWIGQRFQSYISWKILKTIENKRNVFLFLAVPHNQCYRLPTDPAKSQHIMLNLHQKRNDSCRGWVSNGYWSFEHREFKCSP